MPATLKVCPRYANAPACGCTAAQSRPEGFSTGLLKGGGGRAALAHNGCFADAPKRFIARELTLPLLDCGMAGGAHSALLCCGLQINFVPISFAQQGEDVYTNEASQ
jgi:hypothetical protein